MSPSAYITTRTTTGGEKRYVVRYRRGGRGFKVEHAGSFTTQREAKIRRDFVAGELAAGRDPRQALRAASTTASRNYREWADAYKASRIDFAPATQINLEKHLARLLPFFGERDPATITVSDCQEWIAAVADLSPGSVAGYFSTHRMILDFAGIEPNPARDRRVKLPAIQQEEPQPPTAKQLLAMLQQTPSRWVLPMIVLEQTAMRVGEAESLAWGDVDVAGAQFRLRSVETKTRKARWVQVPDWLVDEIAATCPLEDRTTERRVFPGFSGGSFKNVMARACKAAGLPHFHPHDLRHRRLSLWHGQGLPARQLAERAGHARASMSLDRYSHVMPLEEVSRESFEAVLVRSR